MKSPSSRQIRSEHTFLPVDLIAPIPARTRRRTLLSLLIVFSFAVLCHSLAVSTAHAGANETPGKSFRPHTFGYFNPNAWEFGPRDIQIFQRWVVRSQHYRQGSAYIDPTSDLSPGGAGIWNFFTFCTDRTNDVMLVASHGVRNPLGATLIESYPRSARGRAVRDSTLNYWNGTFVAGSFQAQNWRGAFVIVATQTFYTTYFQTAQAFCYWATCWSSHLNMTGTSEARCYLGYDRVVTSGKCYCDENYILSRMDGQSGQARRPLAAAFVGANGACPDAANLVTQGRLNTVLSPSVTGAAPRGIVCQGVPGFVSFDTTMDTRINPATVVNAWGDGFLINHAWVGDDRIEFDVVPTAPFPNILYDVVESRARSKADHARLDGNTNPPVNARGPNRDDYIWLTACPPGGTPVTPVISLDPDYPTTITAGTDLVVSTPLYDLTGQGTSATVTFNCSYLPQPLVQNVDFITSSTALLTWIVPIPDDAAAGEQAIIAVDVTHPDGDHHLNDVFTVDFAIGADLAEPTKLGVGTWSPMTLLVENLSEVTAEILTLELTNIDGWAVVPSLPFDPLLAPGDIRLVPFEVEVPSGLSAPYLASFDLQVSLSDGDTFNFGYVVPVSLPLEISLVGTERIVPGSQNGTMIVEVENFGQDPIALDFIATDSFGSPVAVNVPTFLNPGETVVGHLVLDVPPDPLLMGESGTVFLQAQVPGDPDFFVLETLPYQIEPPLRVAEWFTPEVPYTGHDFDRPFDVVFVLENQSDQPVTLFPNCLGELPVNCPAGPIEILPAETLELPIQVIVPVGLPSASYDLDLQFETDLGSLRLLQPLMVLEPVLPDPVFRAVSESAGLSLMVQFVLENVRPDVPMDGSYRFSDSKGWTGPQNDLPYALAPGAADTVQVLVSIPPEVGVGDTTQVRVEVDFVYDTGEAGRSATEVTVVVTSGDTSDAPDLVVLGAVTRIEGVGPNPFRPFTTVRFQLAEQTRARLSVHDASGRRVAGLADRELEAGPHSITWTGRDDHGAAAPAGVYFFRLETSAGRWSIKGIRMK